MKYQINQKLYYANYKCRIVGTKETPFKPKIDPYRRTEIYPENGYDYILQKLDKIESGHCSYKGLIHATENEIIDEDWEQ